MHYFDTDAKINVSVIILSKNGAEFIDSVLRGILHQDYAGAVEVIVIDSGSEDKTLDIVQRYPVRLVQILPSEFGHGRTRNFGASLAQGKHLVYLPQDATPIGTKWLATMVSIFSSPKVAGGYCRQIPRPNASAMEQFFLLSTYHTSREVRYLSGNEKGLSLKACFFSNVGSIIRASVWKRFPFREDLIMSEDQAWAAQVMRAGYSIIYEPKAWVFHSHQYTISDIFRRNFDSGYSIRQIYNGVTGYTLVQNLRNLFSEAQFVYRSGNWTQIIRFPFYEIARFLGFWLGMNAKMMPTRWRKKCSNLSYFWDEND